MAKQKGTVKQVSTEELQRTLGKVKDDERRTEQRLEAKLDVEVPMATWDQFRQVYTTNISKGGLLFALESPATVASTMQLTLTLPDGKRVTIDSDVRHVARRPGTTDFEVGVQFRDLGADARQALEAALSGLKAS